MNMHKSLLKATIATITISLLVLGVGSAQSDIQHSDNARLQEEIDSFNQAIKDGEEIARLLGSAEGASQFVRGRIITKMQNNSWSEEERNRFIKDTTISFQNIDSANTEIAKEVLKKWSWRQLNAIEPQFVQRTWLAVTHSKDIQWQAEVLEGAYELVGENIIPLNSYANLYDLVSLEKTGLLTYGTRLDCTPDGIKTIDGQDQSVFENARRSIGLPNMDDAKQKFVQVYGECGGS